MKRLTSIAAAFLLAVSPALADEGMWLPALISQRIEDMHAKGFKLSAEDIYSINRESLKDAVMLFGGGCTGELVSPEGLLFTNHHCGYSYIQKHSSVEHDYLKDGFWALERKEELPNPGLSVKFLDYMEDVTAEILGAGDRKAVEKELIRKAVEGSGIEITGTFWYGGEASRENMDMLRPQVADADMIFAVGGGKAIDTCKVLAHETNRPFFTFPTIASTCASCTSLGIVYHPDGSLREYSFSKIPPNHIFINSEIIANAPVRYLWAGMGDTMAKHYECTISSRNDVPAHSDAMGIALSSMCAAPILRWGKQAMADCEAHRVTPELTEIIEAIIISTGYVSNFVQVDYTTGMAHAMYNGFTILPSTEEYHHLHGEVVSYGILVMLTADKQYAERDRLLAFNRSIGLPTHLADIHAKPEDLPAVTEKALAGIDVRVWPYPVAQQMLIDAVMELEQVG